MIPAVSLQHMRDTVAGWSDEQKAEAKAIREAIMAVSSKPKDEAAQLAFWYVQTLIDSPLDEEQQRAFNLGVKLHWCAISQVVREKWDTVGKTWADIDGNTVIPTEEEFDEIIEFANRVNSAAAYHAVKPVVLWKMFHDKPAVIMWFKLECVDAEIRASKVKAA